MAHFRYQALNAEQQPVTGELQAETVAQALVQLEAQGLSVQSIGYAAAGAGANAGSHVSAATGQNPFRPLAAPSEAVLAQALLERYLEPVLQRGRSLVPALRAYAEEISSSRRRRELLTVVRVLDRGDAHDAAAALQSLPTYWIPLLSAASVSGDPGRILREFLKESERAEELRRQWWQTLAYPLFILAAVGALLIFFSFVVIPVFRNIFYGFGLRLPGLTVFVLTVAEWISSGRILGAIVLVIVTWLLLTQLVKLLPLSLREYFGNRFGTLLGRKAALARFSQFLADLLEAELDPANALRLAGIASASPRLKRAAWRLAGELETDSSIPPSPYRPIVTASVFHALRADLPTQSRVALLRELSVCHAEQAASVLSWTRGIFEPLLVVAVGLTVGSVAIALFLPLIGLIQGLSF